MGQSKTRTKGIYTEADGSKTVSKTWKGERIYCRLGDISQEKAETWLHNEIEKREREFERRKSSRYLFAECAQRYLTDCIKKKLRTLDTIAIHISAVIPFIGNLEVEKVHDETLVPFIEAREDDGVKPSTINRALEVVRTILIKSARVYRDENGMPWLKQAPPLISMLEERPRKSYPLSWDEQDLLFELLPNHIFNMAMFAVNTGLRDENVCGLRWSWELNIPELGRSVFVIPAEFHKSGRKSCLPLVVILNDTAWEIINKQRGRDKVYVFVYRQERLKNFDVAPKMPYHRIETMNNSAWHNAREKVNLTAVRIHDLRHTYATRLRAAGVSNEDRASLLGHAVKTMPEHYAAATIKRLIHLSNKVLIRRNTVTVLNVVNA